MTTRDVLYMAAGFVLGTSSFYLLALAMAAGKKVPPPTRHVVLIAADEPDDGRRLLDEIAMAVECAEASRASGDAHGRGCW